MYSIYIQNWQYINSSKYSEDDIQYELDEEIQSLVEMIDQCQHRDSIQIQNAVEKKSKNQLLYSDIYDLEIDQQLQNEFVKDILNTKLSQEQQKTIENLCELKYWCNQYVKSNLASENSDEKNTQEWIMDLIKSLSIQIDINSCTCQVPPSKTLIALVNNHQLVGLPDLEINLHESSQNISVVVKKTYEQSYGQINPQKFAYIQNLFYKTQRAAYYPDISSFYGLSLNAHGFIFSQMQVPRNAQYGYEQVQFEKKFKDGTKLVRKNVPFIKVKVKQCRLAQNLYLPEKQKLCKFGMEILAKGLIFLSRK